MIIEVKEGQDIIKILSDGFVSCLIIKKAVVVNWPDCRGSIGEYYSISNYVEEDGRKLINMLNDVLLNGDENQILEATKPFLNLFSEGTYKTCLTELNLKTSSFYHENETIYSGLIPDNENFSNGMYPIPENLDYFFTILNRNLNKERIDFYINLIENGSRPKIIIFESCNLTTGQYSSSYILDGHHKLKAYLKLGFDIPAVMIMKIEKEEDKTEEILRYIKPILKSNEYNHIISNNK